MTEIVRSLIAAQDAADLSSGEVARRIGASPSTVSRYRSGQAEPSLHVAEAWARACGARLAVVRELVAMAQDLAALAEELTLDELRYLTGVARALLDTRHDPMRRAVVIAAVELAASRAEIDHVAVRRRG